ncbi:MAG: sigma-70 family RNA polymerase sigma factor [bacterium]
MEELLHRAQRGDQTAFAELVRQHQNLVYTLALRILANPEDALDVSQDVFVRVWRALPRFEGRSAFSTWLYRITANICLDYLKRRKRDRHWNKNPEQFEPKEIEEECPVEEEIHQLELKDQVSQVLARMNANYRSALVLRDIYGFAYEEVASTLHISLSAAKIRIYRARLDFKSRYRALVGTKEKKHDVL